MTRVRWGETWVPLTDRSPKKMRFGQGALWMTVVCGFLAAAQTQETGSVSVSTSIQVTSEALAAQPAGANWLSYNGVYTGRRFSSLEQITTKHAEQLRAQSAFHATNST